MRLLVDSPATYTAPSFPETNSVVVYVEAIIDRPGKDVYRLRSALRYT